MTTAPSPTIQAINAKTAARIRSYFESRSDWNLSRSLKNLIEQAIHDYEHRAVLELVQNAHDAQPKGSREGRILIRLDHDEGEHGTLVVANTGNPFSPSNFDAICDVAQSDKRADEGIGNKGIGFKSTLQLCRVPEIYSSSAPGSTVFDGYCFRFATDDDLLAAVDGDKERAFELSRDVFHLCLPLAVSSVPPAIASLRSDGYVTAIRLPLKSEAARDEAVEEVLALESDAPILLFLRRISTLVVEERRGEEVRRRIHAREERDGIEIDDRSTVSEVDLGDHQTFLVAERIIDAESFRSAIERSVEADRISAGWSDWTGEARVGIGVSTGTTPAEGRLYTFLPMGPHARAPLAAHVNAPFFAKLARVDFEESVPLNDFLLDEVASLAAALVLSAKAGNLPIEPTVVADLLTWSPPAHDRLVAAFGREQHDVRTAPVLPLRGGQWGSFAETRCWDDGTKSVFTTKALIRSASAKLLDESIRDVRLDGLDSTVETISGAGLHPDDDEIADWAEALAARGAKKAFSPRWWEAFYDELADAISLPASLRGRRILIDDDLGLQRCAGSPETKGPTPFFSPKADDAISTSEEDLRIPATLKRQIVFVNQQLRWTERVGSTSVRRPGRRMLDQQTAGLVNEYRATELFTVLNRALRSRPTAARCQDALRWAYRFVRSRDDPPWTDIAGVAFQVPTAAGDWILATDAFFSTAWGATEDEVLGEFIARTTGLSADLDALARRLLPAPDAWPFDIDDRHDFRQFLERLGVRTGLWPQPVLRSVLSNEGRFFEDTSAHTSVPLPDTTRAQWRSSIRERAPRNLRPYTSYRALGPQHVLPGQVDYAAFDDTTRRLYAQLVVLGLDQWDDAMLDVVVRRHNDASDRFSWPTPVRAFLERTEWLPMARPGERQAWYYVRPDEAWSHGFGEESAPAFAPLVPHALRRLTELRPSARSRLGQLGVRFWDSADTGPDRIRLLAELLRDGELGDAAAAAFRKAYEDAWEDVVQRGAVNPFNNADDAWVVATRRSQLVAVSLAPADDGEPIYVQDAEGTQALRLLEQRPVPLVRLRRGLGSTVSDVLAGVAGARVRRVSATPVTVRVDGSSFTPAGAGELLTDGRRWLVDLVTSLTELRSGSFRRLGSEAIRRTRETVQRIRLVLAENIETLVDGEQVEGANRALALSDAVHPTIVVARSAAHDEATLLQTAAPSIAELIGYPDLADSIRLSLIDLSRLGHLDGPGPSIAAIAEVIGEPEARLQEIAVSAEEPLLELANVLVPLVAAVDVAAAADLWSSLDSFADDDAVTTWLEQRLHGRIPVSQLVSLAKAGDLETARVSLGIDLADLNGGIEALGPPFQVLRNPEGIEQSFQYYVHRHREQILAALREAFRTAYLAFEPLDEYVGRRDLSSLRSDPTWVEHYYDVPDDAILARVEEWLAEVGASLTQVGQGGSPPIDDLRRANRAVLNAITESASVLIRAWERRSNRAPSGLPGDTERVVDEASASGQLDFEPLTAERALALLVHGGRWPSEMAPSLDPNEIGIEASDLDEVRETREDEERLRRDAARQISIDGETVSAEQHNYAAIVDAVRHGITPELLAIPPEVADLPAIPPGGRRGGGTGTGPGVTAARRRRLSDVQVGAVGLAGEVVALEWLKANYEDATDASWRSGYRNLVLGGNEGDDSLGYDFEVLQRRRRLLFEVKTSVSDVCEFDLTDAEIRAAQRIRRSDRYYILYVTHVLTGDERRIHLLPNPLGTEGLGRYRTVGSGLRLRFTLS